MDAKVLELQKLIEGYEEEVWADEEIRDNLMYLLGRFLQTGQDVSDQEVEILTKFIKEKLDKFIKEKAH